MPPTTIIPETGLPATPRPRLLRRIEDSLLAGQIIHLDEQRFRACRRGEQFEEGDLLLEAQAHGVFGRYEVYDTLHASAPTRFAWCWLGPPGLTSGDHHATPRSDDAL